MPKTRRAGKKYQARRLKALFYKTIASDCCRNTQDHRGNPEKSTPETTPWPSRLTAIHVDPVHADLDRIPDGDPRLAHYIVLRLRNP
jgi:hypothetical protein